MTWRRALDLLYLAVGVALVARGLVASGTFPSVVAGVLLVLSTAAQVAVPDYKFDPQKSAIQQWRERRRAE